MSYDFCIQTRVYSNNTIVQTLNNATGELNKWVLDTREKHIVRALESLGWRPPKVNAKLSSAVLGNKPAKSKNIKHNPKLSRYGH